MAEGIPEGDEVRRIIINAKGEVKNVVPPVPESQNEPETPEKTSGSNTAETVAKIGAGIAVGEIGEALINQVGKTARRILHGGSGERGKENDPIKNAVFAKVMSMSNDLTLSGKDRAPWVKEKESRIEEFKKFDNGDFIADTKEAFQSIMRTSEWDKESGKGVYMRLTAYSESRDREYSGRHESRDELKGLMGVAIRAEAARILVAGVENKLRGITNDSDVDSWLNGKHYTDEELNRLSRLAKENHIFDFATDAPEEIVGNMTDKKESAFVSRRIMAEEGAERKQSLREIPLYFGAVFAGGKNEVYVDRPDLIPTLDINDEDDRNRFIFKNIHAFDYRFGNGSAWKSAVGDWIKDFNISNEGAKLDPEISGEFLKKLKAMMAVTASARAMENSAGVAKSYLVNLVGANERGDPNLDEQDISSSLLLHADPEKMIIVLRDPLVKHYYDILMADAGLVNDGYHEWREFRDPNDTNKKIQVASEVVLDTDPKLIRERGRLVEYLKNSADKGGFQGYIDEVFLENNGTDEELAAAKIACDLFLVDKWTRWEDLVTNGGKESLDLQPQGEWGGDPLKGILKPTSLPRIKKVYTGKDEVILDLVDLAIKPDDIFSKIQKDARKYEDTSKIHAVIPSMVTNLKTISRLSDATFKVFGGSMSTGIPNWSPKMMQEELPQIADLLTQVYGNLKIKEKSGGNEVLIGKHIVGDMMMRLIYAKSLASAVESSKPGFAANAKMLFDPENRTRPFLEVMQFLYGPDLDARRGFVQSLVGGRTRLVVKGNKFDAEKYYKRTWDILQTNNQTGKGSARTLNTIGFFLDVAQSIARATGVVKR